MQEKWQWYAISKLDLIMMDKKPSYMDIIS